VNKRHRKLMHDLAAAKPILPPDLEDWGKGESAKRVLDQIVSKPMPEPARPEREPRFKVRLAYATFAVVVVFAAAAFLALHFLGGAGQKQVVSQPTVTSFVSQVEPPVTVQEALEQIIALAKATPAIKRGQSSSRPGQTPEVIEDAVAFRLIPSVDAGQIQLDQTVTQGQFVLWLWRVFGSALPQGSTTAAVPSTGTLSPEEQRAVDSLVQNGVIQLAPTGDFEAGRVLTQSEAAALLRNVRALLE
jgi:hypothetical protein